MLLTFWKELHYLNIHLYLGNNVIIIIENYNELKK